MKATLNLEQEIDKLLKEDHFDYYQKKYLCDKLETNELTLNDDLYVIITDPEIKKGIFSNSCHYNVKTYPLKYDVIRRESDFEFLNEKIKLLNPLIYTPILHFQLGLKDDSSKKVLYIQNYMNLLLENKYFRSLPIINDFLTLDLNDWKTKKKVYSKIKAPNSYSDMPNFDGIQTATIDKESDNKAIEIESDINSKIKEFDNLNTKLDELIANFDNSFSLFKKVAFSFHKLQMMYKSNKLLFKSFGNYFNIFEGWMNDILLQKNFIRDEIKYFFKYLNKEFNTFLTTNYRNYNESKKRYIDLRHLIKNNILKKKQYPKENELVDLDERRQYYAFNLTYINKEYINLEIRQTKRIIKQTFKNDENRNIFPHIFGSSNNYNLSNGINEVICDLELQAKKLEYKNELDKKELTMKEKLFDNYLILNLGNLKNLKQKDEYAHIEEMEKIKNKNEIDNKQMDLEMKKEENNKILNLKKIEDKLTEKKLEYDLKNKQLDSENQKIQLDNDLENRKIGLDEKQIENEHDINKMKLEKQHELNVLRENHQHEQELLKINNQKELIIKNMEYQSQNSNLENELRKLIIEKIPKENLLPFFQGFFQQTLYLKYNQINPVYVPMYPLPVPQDANSQMYEKPKPEVNLNNDNNVNISKSGDNNMELNKPKNEEKKSEIINK